MKTSEYSVKDHERNETLDEVQLKEWLYKMESGDQEAFRLSMNIHVKIFIEQ